jgi:S-adenosylmethionine:tRNA ribosyltransferase-isomerase
MNTIDSYFYNLPGKLIASKPARPREKSRLLVFNATKNKIHDETFSNLVNLFNKCDLLILNNSKVFTARLFGKKETGGKIETLLLREDNNIWSVIIGGKIEVGDKILFSKNLEGEIINKTGKEAKIIFNKKGLELWKIIDKIGKMPIPPYIKKTRLSERELRLEYQTVYAGKYGSSAAPTAGLHFSKNQIGELLKAGVGIEYIDLNIGLGTFAPLSPENMSAKKLHSEKFQIPRSTIEKIIQTKKQSGRIIAVGTTTVRALESVAMEILENKNSIRAISDSTEIFIQPGFQFKIVDSLITNFHLPSSSLMMLVSAFIENKGAKDGREKLLEIYQHAIKNKYRFYSFGDAMIVL